MFKYVPRKMKELRRTPEGNLILDEDNLRTLCLIDGLYEYPEMNNKLYLHYKSIVHIQGLEKYTNLKAIYLENNIIIKIQNLACLTCLQSLFLHNNMITKMENIDCPQLKILNLSGNQIHTIEGLDHLKQLQSLTLSNNFLKTFQSVEHLGICSQTLTNIDLADNQIQLDERMIPLFVGAKCLYMTGNPFVKDLKFYRRRMVGELTGLVYLDQKGVDQEERIKAVAWMKEGDEGLKKAKLQIQKIKSQQKAQKSRQLMKDIDIHRQKKINLFSSAILDCKAQINKFLSLIQSSHNYSFYVNKIQQEHQKISNYYDMIIDIQKRMGKTQLTQKEVFAHEPIPQGMVQQEPQGILELMDEVQVPMLEEGLSDRSTQEKLTSEEGSEGYMNQSSSSRNESQNSSNKGECYQQLD